MQNQNMHKPLTTSVPSNAKPAPRTRKLHVTFQDTINLILEVVRPGETITSIDIRKRCKATGRLPITAVQRFNYFLNRMGQLGMLVRKDLILVKLDRLTENGMNLRSNQKTIVWERPLCSPDSNSPTSRSTKAGRSTSGMGSPSSPAKRSRASRPSSGRSD